MGLFDAFRPRTSGEPTSTNGASSMHLRWRSGAAETVAVSAVLEVLVPPAVDRLYFWALQASFSDGARHLGAGHVGLQWHPEYPGATAVNWGGYDAAGRELAGSESLLPSTLGNPNTRDFRWESGRAYRLSIARSDEGWRGAVTDIADDATTVVRDLHCGGDRLADPMVWSEVFARCDDPSVTVRWSHFETTGSDGSRHRSKTVGVNYQSRADGGCDNTTVWADNDGVLQVTNSPREVGTGTVLHLHDV